MKKSSLPHLRPIAVGDEQSSLESEAMPVLKNVVPSEPRRQRGFSAQGSAATKLLAPLIATLLTGCSTLHHGSRGLSPIQIGNQRAAYVKRLNNISEGDALNGALRGVRVETCLIETLFGPGADHQHLASVTFFDDPEKASCRTFLYSPDIHLSPSQMQSLVSGSDRSGSFPKLIVEKVFDWRGGR